MVIDIGKYKMRNGDTAVITDTGCFAYGTRGDIDDFWQLADGKHIPLKPGASGNGHSRYDLMERVS